MKANLIKKVSSHSTQNLLSSSLPAFKTNKTNVVNVSFVKRSWSSQSSRQIESSKNPISQSKMNKPQWALVQSNSNTTKILEHKHEQINTNKLTHKLSPLKINVSDKHRFQNIVWHTALPLKVYNNRFNFNREYGQTLDHHRRDKKESKRRRRCCGGYYYCCPCSLLRMFLCFLAFIVLGAIIAAIIIGLTINQKTTTTKTTTTTMTTTSTSSMTTSTSTTVTTTTTTAYICNKTCLNQTWQLSSNLLSEWLFDEDFSDQTAIYNATSSNNVSFTTNGYIQQAAVFTINANQLLTVPHMPLSYTSFTIEAWIFVTSLTLFDHSIFGLCPVAASHQCLHLTIRQSSSNFYLYLGFYSDDCQGITPVTLNTWIHVAFVFDMTNMKQMVYYNGILDATCSSSSAITATSGNVTIGYIAALPITSANNYFRGYIDHLSVSTRAKLPCEILEDATLATYFAFNTGLLLNDSGPNSLQATTQSVSISSSGHFAQALTFSGSSSSYFQINDVTTLGISNRPFSISLWIRPTSLSGVLVHVSNNASGLGWCLPFLGFATNGSLVAQILNTNGIISVSSPSAPIISSTWIHIVQTWSSTNGLRLYIDNILVASSLSLATTYTASTISNYVTLGNSLTGNTCNQGQLGPLTPYQGDIDDFRIYSRELNAADVCTLYVA